jgi:hypothetical protein
MLGALSLVVGMSGCVVHERRDWRDRRYGRERYDHDNWDRDRGDRYSERDCWREGRDWICRR